MANKVENFFNNAEEFSLEDSQNEIEPFENENLLGDSSTVELSDKFIEDFADENFDIIDKIKNSLNLKNSNNPFYEVFDSKSVVNRGETSDFIIEDLLRLKQEKEAKEKINKNKKYYISKQELEQILTDNPGIKFYKKDDNGNVEELSETENINFENQKKSFTVDEKPNENELIEIIIPAADVTVNRHSALDAESPENSKETQHQVRGDSKTAGSENENHFDDFDDDDETYYISEEEAEERRQKKELQEKLKGIQDAIEAMKVRDDYRNPDEIFSEFLQENFKDYLLAKKITGNNQMKFGDKIIAQEIIEDANKSIEIADLTQFDISKKTSILINRDDEMEIESIEVLCKCGEKTVIKFDAVEDFDATSAENLEPIITDSTNTQIVIDTVGIVPLDYSIENEKAKENYQELVSEEMDELVSELYLENEEEEEDLEE